MKIAGLLLNVQQLTMYVCNFAVLFHLLTSIVVLHNKPSIKALVPH